MTAHSLRLLGAGFAAVALIACSRHSTASDAGEALCSDAPGVRSSKTVFGGTRPVTLKVPKDYDPACRTPLLLVLHGYGVNGPLEELYLGAERLVDTKHVLLASPTGTTDRLGSSFWNATDACCNYYGSGVDDVGYIRGLIEEISAEYNVDRRRVFLFGHSNGGFLAYRFACEAAAQVAAIVSLAGATYNSPAQCSPSNPVSVLEIHGDKDSDVLYEGGANQSPPDQPLLGSPPYPGAARTVELWAGYDGCGPSRVVLGNADLDSTLPGDETIMSRHEGCPSGIDVELWTIVGGAHIPSPSPSFLNRVWRWLEAHPRP